MRRSVRKRILTYRTRIDGLLKKEDENWSSIMQEHLQQISFFQHERLIHLIVTATFALLEICSIGFFVLSGNPGFGLMAFAVLLLLVPYIRHYYLLENEVQNLYVQYDRLLEKM